MRSKEPEEGVTFNVKVVPRSSRTEVVSFSGSELKLKVKSPPIDGQANDEIISFIASCLGVKTSNVTIVKGKYAAKKIIHVKGATGEDLKNAFKHRFHP